MDSSRYDKLECFHLEINKNFNAQNSWNILTGEYFGRNTSCINVLVGDNLIMEIFGRDYFGCLCVGGE
jgi:hypothetical protein